MIDKDKDLELFEEKIFSRFAKNLMVLIKYFLIKNSNFGNMLSKIILQFCLMN